VEGAQEIPVANGDGDAKFVFAGLGKAADAVFGHPADLLAQRLRIRLVVPGAKMEWGGTAPKAQSIMTKASA
jgi:hypothetical protein